MTRTEIIQKYGIDGLIEYDRLMSEGKSGDFALSALIGYASDSAILGAIFGGSITGAILGDLFDGDLFD